MFSSKIQQFLSVNLWGQVRTLRGLFLVSRTDGDPPPLSLLSPSPPCVCTKKPSLCRFKTSPPAPRPHVVTHVNVHTEAFLNVHTGTPHTPHTTTHNTTRRQTERQRQRQLLRERQEKRKTRQDKKRKKKTRKEKTRQDKKRKEKRR